MSASPSGRCGAVPSRTNLSILRTHSAAKLAPHPVHARDAAQDASALQPCSSASLEGLVTLLLQPTGTPCTMALTRAHTPQEDMSFHTLASVAVGPSCLLHHTNAGSLRNSQARNLCIVLNQCPCSEAVVSCEPMI